MTPTPTPVHPLHDQLSRELHAQNTTLHRFIGTPQRAWMTAAAGTGTASGTASGTGTARKRSHAGATVARNSGTAAGSGAIAMGALVSVTAPSTGTPQSLSNGQHVNANATANAPAMLPPARPQNIPPSASSSSTSSSTSSSAQSYTTAPMPSASTDTPTSASTSTSESAPSVAVTTAPLAAHQQRPTSTEPTGTAAAVTSSSSSGPTDTPNTTPASNPHQQQPFANSAQATALSAAAPAPAPVAASADSNSSNASLGNTYASPHNIVASTPSASNPQSHGAAYRARRRRAAVSQLQQHQQPPPAQNQTPASTQSHLLLAQTSPPTALSPPPKLDLTTSFPDPMNLHLRVDHKSFEFQRLGMLARARESNDLFYLILHQLYCALSLQPGRALNGLTNVHRDGINNFAPMLVLNSLLDSEFLYKSANYPDQIETCLASIPHYASTYHRVLLFLSKVAANMHKFDAAVKERGFPPLIEEMVAVFAVPSRIVQHVIHTAYCRVLIGERQGKDAWLVEYEVVHKKNQKLYKEYLSKRTRILAMQRQNGEEQEQSAAMLEQLGVASSRDRQMVATMYAALREEMLKGATPTGKGEWAVVLFAAQQKIMAREGRWGSSSGGNTSSASSQIIPAPSTAAAANARVVAGPPRQQQQHQQQPRQREQPRARITAAQQQQQQQRMQSTRIQPPPALMTSFPATAPTTATAPMQADPLASAPNWPTRPQPHPHPHQPSQLLTSASNAMAALQNTAIAMPPQQQQAYTHPVTVSTARAAQQATIAAREAAAAQRHVSLVQQPQPQQPQVQPPAPLVQQSGLLMHMPTALPYHTRQNQSQALVQVQPQQQQQQQQQQLATTTTATTTPAAATALESIMATLPSEVRAPLLPPSNVHPTLWANPRPRFIALHEAHLAYNSRPVNSEGKIDRSIELFQFFETFMIPPKQLNNKLPTVTWTIDVSADLFRKLPIPTAEPSIGGEPLWALEDGKKLVQLRCIKDPKGRMTSDHRWAVAETAWPDCIFFNINGTELPARRKTSYGKDLPLNLTPFLTEGRNHLQITVLHDLTPRPSKPQPQYMAAVEIIDTASRRRVRNMVRSLSATKSLSDIQKRLNASVHASAALNTDEICLVDDDITIDLIDPFTAVLFQTPVRGTSCSHRECFDLDIYLQTRLTRAGVNKVSAEKMAEGEGMPEEWKCPICGQDARPRSLMIDGFLVEVRRKLVAEGRLDARAVRVKKDGTWEVKVRVEGDGGRAKRGGSSDGKRRREEMDRAKRVKKEGSGETGSGSGSNEARPEPTVIELD